MNDVDKARSEIVISQIEENKRVLFITGRAGTGKSTLLRRLVSETKKKHAVLAPTGIAAVNIGGETIHSFFKFKPGITPDEAGKLGRRTRFQIYARLDLIIVDEVSMVRADLMDCMDAFLKGARDNFEPFGGVQVVLFGDMYQLEPVVTGDEKDALYRRYESAYFFSSHVFKEILEHTGEQLVELVELTKVFRQKDEYFIEILDNIRKHTFTERHLDDLNRCTVDQLDYGIDDRIYLTGTNSKAAEINSVNLEKIPNPRHAIPGILEGNFSEKLLPTDHVLNIKQHARIMMLNNDPDGRWMNGSLGVIMEIRKDSVLVLLDDGKEHIVLPHTWTNYKFIYDLSTDTIKKDTAGTFTQYPLKLAWAITIHKSQGQTFDKVAICLGDRAFAHGQTYVALSRCRSLEGIVLERPIYPRDIMVDDKVSKFLNDLRKYVLSWKFPVEEKQEIIRHAINNQSLLEVTMLDTLGDVKQHIVKPVLLINSGITHTLNCIDMDENEMKDIQVDEIISLAQVKHQALLSKEK
ncbi:MAG: hypothetical protein RI947_646 [Candidatus Parcubacteria bacterium]|jgi:GTPase SAR1 family protein